MSKRDNVDKTLGTRLPKRQNSSRRSDAECYEWKDGEAAIVIAHSNLSAETYIYCLPESRVHPLLKPSVKAVEPNSEMLIHQPSEYDENNDVFDHLTLEHIRKWHNGEEDKEEQQEEGEEGEAISDDEKENIMDTIFTWIATLGPWRKNPTTAIKIVCRVSAWECE